MEDIIKAYRNVPYFNNKTRGKRAGLRVEIGKGSPKEIMDEVRDRALLQKIDLKSFNDEELKKFMVDNNIGIECSGFAFWVLNEESLRRGKSTLKGHLKFPFSHGVLGRLRSAIRPIENTDVKTFAHDENSRVVLISDSRVGDMITMTSGPDGDERDHILVINKVEPSIIYYVHAVTWPTDGEYGHGIHEGKIEIINPEKSIVEQNWVELGKTGEENYTHMRAKKSVTELRRLNWF